MIPIHYWRAVDVVGGSTLRLSRVNVLPLEESESTVFLIGLFVVILGVVGIMNPRLTWYLNIGWKLRNSEPSDAALVVNRVVGVGMVLLGIIMTLSSLN